MSIPKSIVRIFNSDESRNKHFKEDIEVLINNQMQNCEINETKLLINMSGTFYAYRSPSMGNAILQMPIDKIEIVESVSDLPFLAAAMESITSTQISQNIGTPKDQRSLLLK